MIFADKLERLRVPQVSAPDGSTEEGDWDAAVPVPYWCTPLELVQSSEDLEAQNLVKSTHTIQVDPFADFATGDRIEYDGATYEIEGRPTLWKSRRSRPHHWKLFVYRVTGG